MLKRTGVALIAMALMWVGTAFGAASTGATFLQIGVGARYEAMGGASVAITGDAEAMNSNIAGLRGVMGTEMTFMHNDYLMDITQDYLAAGMALGEDAAVGASLIMVDAGSFYGYSAANQPTGTFSAKDMAFSVGYARAFNSELTVGAALKYVKSEIAQDEASTVAFDIGVIWDKADDPWTIGLAINNIGPGMKFIAEEDPLPTTISVGAAYRFQDRPLLIASQISMPKDDDVSFHLGAEYTIMESFQLRAGYNSSNELDNGITFGLGFQKDRYRIDYGFVPLGVFGDSHRFSFSLTF